MWEVWVVYHNIYDYFIQILYNKKRRDNLHYMNIPLIIDEYFQNKYIKLVVSLKFSLKTSTFKVLNNNIKLKILL